jgi:protein FAM32A
MDPEFKRGKMSFKGEKKKKKRKAHKKDEASVKHELKAHKEPDLTDAEKAAKKRKEKRDLEELKKVASKSHRERVEEYNSKLSNLTEHNDIPRISAAGNG